MGLIQKHVAGNIDILGSRDEIEQKQKRRSLTLTGTCLKHVTKRQQKYVNPLTRYYSPMYGVGQSRNKCGLPAYRDSQLRNFYTPKNLATASR
jgi:hypothetical protein